MSDARASIRTGRWPIIGITPERQPTSSAPSGPVPGQIYFDTTLNVMRQQIASAWVNFIMDTDSRLTNSRTPTGSAGGALSGSYPNPGLGTGVVSQAQLVTSLYAAAYNLGAGAGTAATNAPALRAIGSGGSDVVAGNDSRLSDARTPTGSIASGSLAGSSYPNPTLANNAVFEAAIAGANVSLRTLARTLYSGTFNYGNGTGFASAADAALRHLAYTADAAMPGTAQLNTILGNNGLSGDPNLNGYTFTGLRNPINNSDAANKAYVDAAIQGLSVKSSVRAATTGNIDLTSGSTISTIDGVSMNVNDRILVKNQSTPSQNGIYQYTSVGGTNSSSVQRTGDADTAAELQGAFVFVSEGTNNGNIGWYQTSDAITLGSTAIVWTQFSAAAAYTVVAPLQLNGTQISIALSNDFQADGTTGNTLAIRNAAITAAKIKDGEVTGAKLIDGAVDLAGTKTSNTLPITKGGTGAVSAAGARTTLGFPIYKSVYMQAITADTWTAVTHNIGISNLPFVQIYDDSTKEIVEMDIRYVGPNSVEVRAGASSAAGAYYAVFVVGG